MRKFTGVLTALTLAATASTAMATTAEAWPGHAKHIKKAKVKQAAPASPSCTTVWQGGATLPANYWACSNWGVTYIAPHVPCADGSLLFGFQATNMVGYVGRTGGLITQVDGPFDVSAQWSSAYAACTQ